MPVGGRILQAVVHQVKDKLLQEIAVAHDRHLILMPQTKPNLRPKLLHLTIHFQAQQVHLHRLAIQFTTRLSVREVQEV